MERAEWLLLMTVKCKLLAAGCGFTMAISQAPFPEVSFQTLALQQSLPPRDLGRSELSRTEENEMEQSVEKIIERNLLEVFNARDADSRRAAIDELWDMDGDLIDPGGVHEGVEKINAIVQLLFTQFEDYVFSVRGPGQSMHGVGRLPWSYGPADDPQRRIEDRRWFWEFVYIHPACMQYSPD